MPTLKTRLQAFWNPDLAQKNWGGNFYDNGIGYGGLDYPSGDIQDNNYGYAQAYLSVVSVRQAVDIYAIYAQRIPTKVVKTKGHDANDNEIVATSDDIQVRNYLYEALADHRTNYGIDLINAMIYNAVLYDTIFVEKISNNARVGTGIKVLNSLGVQFNDYGGQISSYSYSWNGETSSTLSPEQVAYEHGFNPFNDLYGSGLLQSAISKVQIESNLDRFLQAFFRNNATLGIIGSPAKDTTSGLSGSLSPEQQNLLKKIINDWHKGVRNSFRPLILNTAVDFEVLPSPDVDKHYDVSNSINKVILNAFGVNPVLVGNSDNTNYKDDLPRIEAQFINTRLKPVLGVIESLINRELLPFLTRSNEYRFEFDYSGYDLITEQDTIALEMNSVQLDNSTLSYNDYREQNDLEPIKSLDDMFMVDGVLVPLDEMGNLWRYKFLIAPSVYNSELITDEPLAQPTSPEDVIPTESGGEAVSDEVSDSDDTDTKTKSGNDIGSSFAYVPLPNNPDIMRLQREIKILFTDDRIEWQDAPTLHISLVYTDMLSDVSIVKIAYEATIEPMNITLDIDTPIAFFDTPGGQALHLRVDSQNSGLMATQANVYNQFESEGNGISEFSKPSDYKPHITLAYIPSDITIPIERLNEIYLEMATNISIFTGTVNIGRDDYVPVAILTAPEIIKSKSHDHSHDDNLTYEAYHERFNQPLPTAKQVRAELVYWKRYIKEGKHLKKAFYAKNTRGSIADSINALEDSDSQLAEISKQIVELGERTKAIQSTRIEFELAVEDLIEQSRDKSITKRQFKTKMMQNIRAYGNLAFIDGLKQGGVEGEPDEDDRVFIETHIRKQRQYVNNLADKIYVEEKSAKAITDLEAQNKPAMWYSKSINPLFEAGKASADKNAMMEWAIGAVEKHCKDCKFLDGQRHRMKTYFSRGIIPKSDLLFCNGFNCNCSLNRVDARARGTLPKI